MRLNTSPGCLLAIALLTTPLCLWLSLRSLYFNFTSISTTAEVIRGSQKNTLKFSLQNGESIVVENVNNCGLGKGRRNSCIEWNNKRVGIRYVPNNPQWVRIEKFGAYWNWFGYLIIAIVPILGFYLQRWMNGDL
jgi:hypothetical protein